MKRRTNGKKYLGGICNENARKELPTICRNTYIIGYRVLNADYSLLEIRKKKKFSLLAEVSRIFKIIILMQTHPNCLTEVSRIFRILERVCSNQHHV